MRCMNTLTNKCHYKLRFRAVDWLLFYVCTLYCIITATAVVLLYCTLSSRYICTYWVCWMSTGGQNGFDVKEHTESSDTRPARDLRYSTNHLAWNLRDVYLVHYIVRKQTFKNLDHCRGARGTGSQTPHSKKGQLENQIGTLGFLHESRKLHFLFYFSWFW